MLPLVSLLTLSASLAAASAYNLQERDTCSCLSPAALTFANSADVSGSAHGAITPTGYTNTANNGQTWAPGDGCLGFVDIGEYDSTVCAGLCDAIIECSSFQIYFEQDTSRQIRVKCSFWGGVVDGSTADGNISNVIGGCNTYTSDKIVPPSGFDSPKWYGHAAFDRSSGSVAADSFIGSKIFPDGTFDTSRCANEMSAQGGRFYNTYLLSKDGVAQEQHCDVYSDIIPESSATYTGKEDNNSSTTISNSFACGKPKDDSSPKPSSWFNWGFGSSSSSSTQVNTMDSSTSVGWTPSSSSSQSSATSTVSSTVSSLTSLPGSSTAFPHSSGMSSTTNMSETTTPAQSDAESTTAASSYSDSISTGLPVSSSFSSGSSDTSMISSHFYTLPPLLPSSTTSSDTSTTSSPQPYGTSTTGSQDEIATTTTHDEQSSLTTTSSYESQSTPLHSVTSEITTTSFQEASSSTSTTEGIPATTTSGLAGTCLPHGAICVDSTSGCCAGLSCDSEAEACVTATTPSTTPVSSEASTTTATTSLTSGATTSVSPDAGTPPTSALSTTSVTSELSTTISSVIVSTSTTGIESTSSSFDAGTPTTSDLGSTTVSTSVVQTSTTGSTTSSAVETSSTSDAGTTSLSMSTTTDAVETASTTTQTSSTSDGASSFTSVSSTTTSSQTTSSQTTSSQTTSATTHTSSTSDETSSYTSDATTTTSSEMSTTSAETTSSNAGTTTSNTHTSSASDTSSSSTSSIMPTSEAMTTSTQSMTTIADIPYATTTTPERGIVTSDASTTVSTTSSMMFASSSTMPVPPTTPAPNGTEHHGGNYTLPGNSTAFPEANHTLPSHNTPFPGANLTLPTNITYPGFNMSKPTMDNATEWQAWNMTKNTGDAYSAASIINSLALTDFCSSLLGYSTPMVTRTIPMTITQGVNATVMAGTLTSGIVNTTVTLPTTLTVTSADSAWANHRKRGAVSPLTTPAPLATLGDAAVSQACSWKAKPVNVTSTISVTTIETAYTTVYMTVPEATVPATTETETAYSTFTVNTCEPTAPSQLIKNPSFECYKAGWDVNQNGAFLFWGPTGTATSEMHAGAQSPGNSANASLPSDAGKDRSQSPGATSSGASKGQSSEDEPSAAGLAPRKAESHLHDTSSVTPCEPAYDGSTFVRLRPAAVHQPSARLGQSMGNLDTGNYWISYKYRVPEYASNNANCSLTVYINDVPIRGAAVSSLVKSTAGWTRAGGFFSIAEELAGPAYTRFEFHCPALPSKGKGKSKVERQNAGKPSGVTSSGADWASMCENWSVPRGEPLLDLDYIHMGVDDGGWAQYHEVTPHGGAADAAIVAA